MDIKLGRNIGALYVFACSLNASIRLRVGHLWGEPDILSYFFDLLFDCFFLALMDTYKEFLESFGRLSHGLQATGFASLDFDCTCVGLAPERFAAIGLSDDYAYHSVKTLNFVDDPLALFRGALMATA